MGSRDRTPIAGASDIVLGMQENSSISRRVSKVWIADPDDQHRAALASLLRDAGFEVMTAGTVEPPEAKLVSEVTAVLIDGGFPADELADTLAYLRRHAPHVRPFLMNANGRSAFDSSDSGSLDSLPKPLSAELLLPLIRQAVRSARDRRRARRLEDRLRKAEAGKQAILDSSLDCIISMNTEGKITEINAATVLTLGYPPDELIGRELVTALFPEAQQDRYRRAFDQFLHLGIEGSRMGRRLEVHVLHANGSEFPAEIAFVPVRVGGRPVFTAYLRDISERRKAENALRKTHERMKRDLEAASRVQLSLLPESLPRVREAALAWKFRPCDELAGDILNVLRLDRDHLGIYVLDVSGHGVPAALHAVMLHRLLSAFPGQSMLLRERRGRIGGYEIVPPGDVLDQLSQRFPLADSRDARYFTIHYGIIDLRTGRYRYAQGGHPAAILASAGSVPRPLGGAGLPIGFDPSIPYEQFEIALTRGDRILLYSDGLTEASGRNEEPFGAERLMQAVHETREMPLRDALGAILDRVTVWRGRQQPEDDISMLAVDWMADRAPSTPTPPEGFRPETITQFE